MVLGLFEGGLAQEVDDVRRVLDHLEWPRAWVIGHSWGGHLLFHFAVAQQHRLLGGLAVDPLDAVGDGGLAGFATEMRNRATVEARASKRRALVGALGGPERDDSLRSRGNTRGSFTSLCFSHPLSGYYAAIGNKRLKALPK